MRSTMLRTSKLSDHASDGSDLISAMNGSKSEPSDAQSDGSKVRSTVLCILLHNTNPNSNSTLVIHHTIRQLLHVSHLYHIRL
ncbi:hypothetical protein RHMOL_Rhmol09G0137400 [Rhododendron molle]|uniref:Uncharacterized protein n=1 Tax=Rhododendron molle TaxID=49168 RepID=A0ACC0MDP4_RHOML|nr:hypothetical protein RHMOL_Rhmol09G0137400 [Rhododendron molle]